MLGPVDVIVPLRYPTCQRLLVEAKQAQPVGRHAGHRSFDEFGLRGGHGGATGAQDHVVDTPTVQPGLRCGGRTVDGRGTVQVIATAAAEHVLRVRRFP